MSRFERICVGFDAFDRDPEFVDQIRDLASAHEAHVELVHVVDGPSHHVWFGDDDDPWDHVVCNERQEQLEEVAERLRADGRSVHCTVPAGPPHIELIRHVHRTRCDLLYIVDEPPGRGEERSFGPTTKKLLRKCPAPVWAARLGSTGHPRRVLVALDLQPSGDDAERPNQRMLDACRRVAGPSTDVILLHVWNVWGEELLRSRMSEVDFIRAMDHARGQHQHALDAWTARFETAGLRPDARLERGEARTMLPRLVDHFAPDLVIMGTLCRTGLPGLIIGNTAERILNRLACSVLTVKPEDFVSPVPLEA